MGLRLYALFEAVKGGDVARVKKLLEKGADLNARDVSGWTPLHEAALNGRFGIAELLIKHGADLNARDKDGNTPLHIAALNNYADVTELLIKHGADLNAKNGDGSTPLHIAAHHGHVGIVVLLIKHGADLNARDVSGWTPLHYAAGAGRADVVKLLLEKGADPTIRSNNGKTPLDVARQNGHERVAEILIGYSLAIFDVETSELYVGGWGKLVVRVRGLGRASLAVEGDVEWINPGVVELSEDCVVEVPVKPRVSGEVPVKVSVESSGVKTSKIVWLKVTDKVRNCTICGAPVEPGAKYCWKCGTKLS